MFVVRNVQMAIYRQQHRRVVGESLNVERKQAGRSTGRRRGQANGDGCVSRATADRERNPQRVPSHHEQSGTDNTTVILVARGTQ